MERVSIVVVFVILARCFNIQGQEQQGICPKNWFKLNNESCYHIFNKRLNWEAAKSACEELGSTLVMVKSQAEQEAVSPRIISERVWIGMHRHNGTSPWFWVDGTQVTYTNWGLGEPNYLDKELCVMIRHKWKWHNQRCTFAYPYVCEVSGIQDINLNASKTVLKVGSAIEISCTVIGGLIDPHITWFKGSEMIVTSHDGRNITTGERQSRLTITNVTAKDEGVYHCNTSTGQQNIGESVTIWVDPPVLVIKPLVMTERVGIKCSRENSSWVEWSATAGGGMDIKPCPNGARGNATRICTNGGMWLNANFTGCSSETFLKLADAMKAIVAGLESNLTAQDVLWELSIATQTIQNNPSRPLQIYGRDLVIAVDILVEISIDSKSVSSRDDFKNFAHVASNLLETTNSKTWKELKKAGKDRSKSLVKAMDRYGLAVAATLNGSTKLIVALTKNLVMRIDRVKMDSPVNSDAAPQGNCVFWRPEESAIWNSSGCRRVPSESDAAMTTCECDHLTVFAALLDPYGPPTKESHKEALEIISTVGCSISLVAVVITIIVLSLFSRPLKAAVKVLINLSAAIAITCVLAIFEGLARSNKVSCPVVAALLHYFLLALFSWMLCEGISLYLKIVKQLEHGFAIEDKMKYFYLFGWGFPAIIVSISLAVTQTNGYGSKAACWLGIESGLMWTVIAPALFVILVNTAVLIQVMREITKKVPGRVESKPQSVKLKAGLRASVALLPLLGITWLFGLLDFSYDTIFFKYIFAIFNSLQGLTVFIFHCVLNDKIKQALIKGKKAHQVNRATT